MASSCAAPALGNRGEAAVTNVTGPLERDALEQGRDIDWGRSRRDALRATTEEYGDDAA